MSINLHFTDYCNYKCKYCFINKESKELSLDAIKMIVDKIHDYSKSKNKDIRINIAGGEPLISTNLQSIVDYIYDKGLQISIITNGHYLTEDFIRNNKDKIIMIGISVDSISSDTNINIGRCSSKSLSIDELLKTCFLIKKYNIKLKINTCISRFNLKEDLSGFYNMVKPDRIKILRVLCDHDNDLSSIEIKDFEWDEVVNKYQDFPNVVFEDNEHMRISYVIIDSKGNVCRDNLHNINNSLIQKDLEDCLKFIGIEGNLI